MDEKTAIRFLEKNGYSISKGSGKPSFPCPSGHNHKSAEARERCELMAHAKTGLTRDEFAEAKNAAARPRYEAAYRMFAEGSTKSEVARHFGVSRNRGGDMVRRGWRYAREGGWATVTP